jgi:hypothetical protein
MREFPMAPNAFVIPIAVACNLGYRYTRIVTREVPKSPDPRPNIIIPTTKAGKELEKKMMMRPKDATTRLVVSATRSPRTSAKIPPGNWLNPFEAANELSRRPATVFPIENSSFM